MRCYLDFVKILIYALFMLTIWDSGELERRAEALVERPYTLRQKLIDEYILAGNPCREPGRESDNRTAPDSLGGGQYRAGAETRPAAP